MPNTRVQSHIYDTHSKILMYTMKFTWAVVSISPLLQSKMTGMSDGMDRITSINAWNPSTPNASKNAELGLYAAA